MKKASILLFILLNLNIAHAQWNGNDLIVGCKSIIHWDETGELYDNNRVKLAQVQGYLAGIIDSCLYLNPSETSKRFKLPSNISVTQAARVVHKYLDKNPEELHKGALWLVLQAFSNAYPIQGD